MHIWSSSHFLLHKFLLLLFVLRVWSISLFSLCRLKSFCLKLTLVIWGLLCLKIHLKKCLRKENKEHSHGCLLKKEEIRQRQEPWPRRSWRWGGAEEDPLQHHSSLAFIAFTKGLKKTAVSGSKRRIHSSLLRFVFRKKSNFHKRLGGQYSRGQRDYDTKDCSSVLPHQDWVDGPGPTEEMCWSEEQRDEGNGRRRRRRELSWEHGFDFRKMIKWIVLVNSTRN